MPKDSRYLVAILTFNRPAQLRRLLDSLVDSLNFACANQVDVCILNNGRQLEAFRFESLDAGLIRVVNRPSNSLSGARNDALAIMVQGGYDALIFLDDDEYVAEDWFSEFVKYASNSLAHIIAAPVLPEFPKGQEHWASTGVFSRTMHKNGEVLKSCATGNTMIKASLFNITGSHFAFSEEFKNLGGEDFDFTSRAHKNGALIEWCSRARAVEPVPDSRLNWSWVANRFRRTAVVEYEATFHSEFKNITAFCGGALRVLIALPFLAFAPKFGNSLFGNAFRRAQRGLAFMSCALDRNITRNEYET